MSKNTPERVIAYIDGFNLYYGMKEANYRRYYWLNLSNLSQNLLISNQVLAYTKYFTSRISGTGIRSANYNPSQKRQSIYLDALSTLNNLKIYEGHFLNKQLKCKKCGNQWASHEEKMTDVNIATELLTDAYKDKYDTALLISADSDLTAPIIAIKKHYPNKNILVAFPPKRRSEHLKLYASNTIRIGRGTIKKSQLPQFVISANGHKLFRPIEWQ